MNESFINEPKLMPTIAGILPLYRLVGPLHAAKTVGKAFEPVAHHVYNCIQDVVLFLCSVIAFTLQFQYSSNMGFDFLVELILFFSDFA